MSVGIENPIHLLFIGAVALLVLGPKRLPGLARALGHGIREFREAIGQGSEEPTEPQAHLHPALGRAPEDSTEPQAHQHPALGRAPEDSTAGSGAVHPVDPVEPIRSGDAPDRRPL